MGLSNDEVAAILRLRDDLERVMNANQGPITAALKAADQMRDIVSPALRQMQEMHGRFLLYPREPRDASERIESQFGMAHVKAVADAFVGLKVFDSEQFSGGISAGIAEQFKLLNSTADHLAGLKALMPPDHLSATITNSLLVNDGPSTRSGAPRISSSRARCRTTLRNWASLRRCRTKARSCSRPLVPSTGSPIYWSGL